MASIPEDAQRGADDLLIVDCLLPGQVRQLGARLTYLSPRRPIKTSASICEIRGGEYVAYDRANFASALRIWLPKAEEGDPEAQTYVGEIYEKGLGASADYTVAAAWYGRAAEQGYSRANINLGYLYEVGLGVERDLTEAMNLYRTASGLSDGELEYVSSIEYANREAAKVETARLGEQVEELQQALAEAESRYAARQSSVAQSRTELDALRAEVAAERQRVLAAETAAESALQTAERSQEDAALESAQRTRVEGDLELARQEAADAQSSNAQLAEDLDRERNAPTPPAPTPLEPETVFVPDPETVARNNQLQSELSDATSTIGKREAEVAQLREELSGAQANTAASRANRAALEARLISAGDELAQARDEQSRLTARLRESELDAAKRERGDAMIIDGLEQALAQRERSLELQSSQIGSLEDDLARSQTLLANAPGPAERDRLEREVVRQQTALEGARAEQKRLTERLATEQIAARRQRQASNTRLAALEQQLAEREADFSAQRAELVKLEEEVAGNRVQLAANDAEKVASVVTRGPAIDIIDPPMLVTRGTPMLSGSERASLELIGRVAPPESLLAFKINGATQPVSTAGVFRYFVAPQERALQLLAIDEEGVSTRLDLDLGSRGQTGSSDGATVAQASGDQNGGSANGAANDAANDAASGAANGAASDAASGAASGAAVGTVGDSADSSIASAAVAGAEGRGARGSGADAGSATSAVEASLDDALRGIDFGGYHALIIGNDDYESMSDLNTAGRDAEAVEKLLRERYGFKTNLLLNATRYDMLAALNRLRETLTAEDNLLVYYAGHGELDDASQRGYWLPVDAAPEDTRNWIPNSVITDQINAIAAKHVMVIADSCYSGTLTRSSVARQPPDMSPALKQRWYTAMAASKVRTVLSSGGVRPVIDGAPGAEHSIFAQALLDELDTNSGVLEAYSLFVKVQGKVAASAQALQVEQNPQYSPIRHSGHEAGEFVFVAGAG